MSKIQNLRNVFLVVSFSFVASVSFAAPQPATELEVSGLSGLKIEIFKRPPNSKKPGEKRPTPPIRPPPTPEFPGDLTISDGVDNGKKQWFPWDPTGANNFPTSPGCTQEALHDLIWQNKRSASDQGKAINGWIQRCDQEISTPMSRHSIMPLIKFATMSYDFLDNPHIRAVKATLPDGRQLSGFIAMKPDNIPRPFVVAKCGVLCDAEASTTHRAFMMHLFDEAPFHVLALANITATDFQRDNKAFSVGGFDEGRQLYQIAQLLRSPDSPIANRISSVHVVGASLGGSGALYSGLYSSVNDPEGQRNIQSVTAICPVVVVENSVKRLYAATPVSTVATFRTIKQLRDLFGFVPVLNRIFPNGWRGLRGDKLYKKVSEAMFEYYRDWTEKSPWDLRPFKGTKVTSVKQFWELNDFRNYTDDVRVPTLTVAAENDDLVKVVDNTKLLNASLKKDPSEYIDTVFFNQGNHCAFGLANGWGNYSMLLREYIVSHSPEAKDHWRENRVRLPRMNFDLGENDRIVETLWKAREGDPNIHLKLKISSPRRIGYRDEEVLVPIKSLPLKDHEPPMGKYEVTSLTRFANTRFSLLDERGTLVTNTNFGPAFVRVWTWE